MNRKTSEEGERKYRIFLVDDHPLVREGLSNLINQQDDLTVCGEAEDAAQALAGIGVKHPDLALIDISLKTASGLELVKDLGVHFPAVALVVLSMHDELLYAERALRAGARGYVMKRETTKDVLTAMRRVLQGDVYVSDKVLKAMARRLGTSRKGFRRFACGAVERSRTRNLSLARPGTDDVADRSGPAFKSKDGASLLRAGQGEVWSYVTDRIVACSHSVGRRD